MKKKIIAAFAASAVLLTAGCGNSTPATTTAAPAATTTAAETTTTAEQTEGTEEDVVEDTDDGQENKNIKGFSMQVNGSDGSMTISSQAEKVFCPEESLSFPSSVRERTLIRDPSSIYRLMVSSAV